MIIAHPFAAEAGSARGVTGKGPCTQITGCGEGKPFRLLPSSIICDRERTENAMRGFGVMTDSGELEFQRLVRKLTPAQRKIANLLLTQIERTDQLERRLAEERQSSLSGRVDDIGA